ncbi:MAG: NUDIX hydrolase [Balneolaceae bacterium]
MSNHSLRFQVTKLIETCLNRKEIFRGDLLHVFKDEAKLPDQTTSTREWIQHPGACAVVPVFRDGTVMLIRQYRYPTGQIHLEVPAGKIDPGEPPLETAIRETEEETGLRVGDIAYAGHFYPCIGYADEIIHIYVAWDLDQIGSNRDDDEFLLTERVPYHTALDMIASGEINDGKTITSLVKAQMWWRENAPFPVRFSE